MEETRGRYFYWVLQKHFDSFLKSLGWNYDFTGTILIFGGEGSGGFRGVVYRFLSFNENLTFVAMWLDGKQQFTCFSQVPVHFPCIVQPFSTLSHDSELDEVTGVDDEDDDTVRQSLQVCHYVLIIKS